MTPLLSWHRAFVPLVWMAGFEPATSCAQSRRTTKLSYTQIKPVNRMNVNPAPLEPTSPITSSDTTLRHGATQMFYLLQRLRFVRTQVYRCCASGFIITLLTGRWIRVNRHVNQRCDIPVWVATARCASLRHMTAKQDNILVCRIARQNRQGATLKWRSVRDSNPGHHG